MSSAGVILAGGRSRRMGTDKAIRLFAGEPLLCRVVWRLAPAVDELLVIGPESLAALAPDARVLSDAVASVGPLSGLYTALKATTCDRIFLVGCDMPFVDPASVRDMLARSEVNPTTQAVVPKSGDYAQPLHTVYTRSCLFAVEAALASDDLSMKGLLARLDSVDYYPVWRDGWLPQYLFNVNTPEDWARAEEMLEE